jgi:hypothetical protein
MTAFWRDRLAALKAQLETGGTGARVDERVHMSFSDEEIPYLQSQPLARLATLGADDQLDVVPIGYEFDGTFLCVGGAGQTVLGTPQIPKHRPPATSGMNRDAPFTSPKPNNLSTRRSKNQRGQGCPQRRDLAQMPCAETCACTWASSRRSAPPSATNGPSPPTVSVHRLHIKATARRRWQDAGVGGSAHSTYPCSYTNPDCEAHNGGTTQPADGQGPGRDVHW